MPKITDQTKIENGTIIGYVRTNKVGSECYFPICSVDEWEEMNEEEAEKFAFDALCDSGMFEWSY